MNMIILIGAILVCLTLSYETVNHFVFHPNCSWFAPCGSVEYKKEGVYGITLSGDLIQMGEYEKAYTITTCEKHIKEENEKRENEKKIAIEKKKLEEEEEKRMAPIREKEKQEILENIRRLYGNNY